jgi:hypothetical protein
MCWLSKKAVTVYMGWMLVPTRLTGRCPIKYGESLRVNGHLRRSYLGLTMTVYVRSLKESRGSATEVMEKEFKTARESTETRPSAINPILLADRNPDGGSRAACGVYQAHF